MNLKYFSFPIFLRIDTGTKGIARYFLRAGSRVNRETEARKK